MLKRDNLMWGIIARIKGAGGGVCGGAGRGE